MQDKTSRLEYLDLELGTIRSKKSIDKKPVYCFSEEVSHHHQYHSEQPQLNFICDLLLVILNNITVERDSIATSLSKLAKNQKSLEILDKLDYLKGGKEPRENQEDLLISLHQKIDTLLAKLPLENLPVTFEKILREIKSSKTPESSITIKNPPRRLVVLQDPSELVKKYKDGIHLQKDSLKQK